MSQQRVEDQQVARLHIDVDHLQAGHVGMHGIAVWRLGLHPFFEMLEQVWHALEPADVAVLPPEDTHTRLALRNAVARNAPVSFAVQLQWSVQAIEVKSVPRHPIFDAYTLYASEGRRGGRTWFFLRLGFFSDAISAKQVAHYLRPDFASAAVVPVSPQELHQVREIGSCRPEASTIARRRGPA